MKLNRQLKGTGTIDDLSYAYDGNQLRAVNDAADRHIGFIEGATPHTVEYTYDENGNLTSDSNKGISGIKYNYLNLPRHMYAGTTKIDYLYTFSGTKVCKLNVDGDTIAHYYAGNFVYEGSSLKYILNEDGMVTTPATSPVYLYALKDHLGNTRLEVNGSGTVTQQTDYYPFGMAFKIAGSSDNKYLYNGKELQDDAIGNGTLGWYDYGARMYDPSIARWNSFDRLSEAAPGFSPYLYVEDNPITRLDPDGNWDVEVHAYKDRGEHGYAVLIMRDNKGNEAYRTTVRVQGYKSEENNYNPRDRQATYGDTPTGTYKIIGWSNILSKRNRKVYGPNDALILNYMSGEAAGKRGGIELHGGRQEVYNSKTGKWERKKNAHLWNTGGCIRIMDDDIAKMQKVSQNLEVNDKTEKPENLTVTDDLVKNGNKYQMEKKQNNNNYNSNSNSRSIIDHWFQMNPNIKVFFN